jgi:hypothetical protein
MPEVMNKQDMGQPENVFSNKHAVALDETVGSAYP